MTVAERLARFVVEHRYADMPPDVVARAKVVMLDTVGVTLAGSVEESAKVCADMVRREGALGEASVVGRGFRSSAPQAAFVNGTASHAADFDHSFVVGGQPMAPIIPATFALAEAMGASGRQVLEAYVTGFEVTAKVIHTAFGQSDAGFHENNVFGVIGAAASCARLLGLDASQAEMALAIAVSMAGGLRANFGTMTKPLHVGLAARDGVVAARLGLAGFTANGGVFEATNGYFHAMFPDVAVDDESFAGLGRTYALATKGVKIKPYPCGGLTHTAVDAILHLSRQHGLTPDRVQRIDVDVPQSTYDTIAFRVPQDELQAKFSMGYVVARALIDGRLTAAAFTPAAIRDARVLRVLDRVEMRVDPTLAPGADGGRPASVTVHLVGGGTLTRHERNAKGSAQVPMTPAELRSKFSDCANGVIGDLSRDQAIEYLDRLDELDDIRLLMELLRRD